jgi:hypothetical protein
LVQPDVEEITGRPERTFARGLTAALADDASTPVSADRRSFDTALGMMTA